MFERFTSRARRVLVLAQEEARLLNHSVIGTEHLLLGLIHEGDGLAAKAIESLGISLEAVRQQVAARTHPGTAEPGGSPPFSPRAKKVLELALREALQLGHNYIGTEHLLLGLVGEGEGEAAQVLQALGADLTQVRARVVALLHEAGPPRAAPGGVAHLAPLGVAVRPAVTVQQHFPVGRRCTAEVVGAGRRPEHFATAYDQLVSLVRQLGREDLDADGLEVSAVGTDDGPGLRLAFTWVVTSPHAGPPDDEHDTGGAVRPPPTPTQAP